MAAHMTLSLLGMSVADTADAAVVTDISTACSHKGYISNAAHSSHYHGNKCINSVIHMTGASTLSSIAAAASATAATSPNVTFAKRLLLSHFTSHPTPKWCDIILCLCLRIQEMVRLTATTDTDAATGNTPDI